MARLLRRSVLLSIAVSTLPVRAAETIALADYLDRARDAGIRIVYSSDLVPARYKVTFDPDSIITDDKIARALEAFGLALRKTEGVFMVVRTDQATTIDPPVAPIVSPPPIEELVVTSSRYQLITREMATATLLDAERLNQRAALANDPVRLANRLPGSSSNGVSGRPHVRGGAEDETLILFDGIRLYEPFHFNHFNNLISGFDGRLIDAMTLYSGGFPVDMGDRLSAAMVIESRAIDPGWRELGLGLYNASWLQHGDDWMIHARHSTIDALTSQLESDIGTPSFADAYGRIEWSTTDGSEWSANLLWFGDDMALQRDSGRERSSSIYGNTYAWLTWAGDVSNTVSVEMRGSIAGVKDDRQARIANPGVAVGELVDSRETRVYHLSHEIAWTPSRRWHVTGGLDYRYLDVEYAVMRNIDFAAPFATLASGTAPEDFTIDFATTGHQVAAWIRGRTRLTPNWTLESGVRIDAQHYENGLDDRQVNPRLSLLYDAAGPWELRLGWGRFSQATGLHELDIADGITEIGQAQRATHLNLGLHLTLPGSTDARLELYRKEGSSPWTWYENIASPATLAPELQPDRIRVSAQGFRSEGIEVALDGAVGAADWWFNYSYSSARDRIDGQEIRRSWDNRHAANAGITTLLAGWQTTLSATWHSGWATTPLRLEGGVVVAGERNVAQYGNFASIDLKLANEWALGSNRVRLEAGLTNLTGRDNVIGFEYSFDASGLSRSARSGVPLAPFLDVYWRF